MAGLGAEIDTNSLLESLSQIGSGSAPPPPAPPAPPAGWDTAAPSPAPPATFIGPGSVPAAQLAIGPGTVLTYTVNYNLTGASNFFTSNTDAIGTAAQMLQGMGLQVTNSSTPASVNPFSNNQAILTLQVTGAGFQSAAAVKALCDNAFAVGVGAQIISSTIAVGAGNSALNWLSQNWQLLAVGGLALLILPKILDDFV